MEQRIKVGAVSYLNTKPLLYGLEILPIKNRIELVVDYPSAVATQLLQGKLDIGFVPVAILPQMADYYIDSDYCIGAVGPVASVCIFSDVPLEQCTKLLLDYQSFTSVNLAKILLKYYWKLDLEMVPAAPGYQANISNHTAGLVIGDRAFEQRLKSKNVYDLAEAWKAFSGLPFVFAAWVSNHPLPEAFIADFNEANAYGLNRLDEVVAQNASPNYDLHLYYTKNISYLLTEAKRQGLKLFLELLKTM